jgi:hypothetical protein
VSWWRARLVAQGLHHASGEDAALERHRLLAARATVTLR